MAHPRGKLPLDFLNRDPLATIEFCQSLLDRDDKLDLLGDIMEQGTIRTGLKVAAHQLRDPPLAAGETLIHDAPERCYRLGLLIEELFKETGLVKRWRI